MIDHALACRIERAEAIAGRAFAEAARAANPEGGAAAEPHCGGWALYSGGGSPVNQALGVGLDGPVEAAAFDALERFFFERGEPAIYEICPFSDPSLLPLLAERGYRMTELSQVLFRSIEDLVPSRHPAGLEVSRAAPEEALLWSQIVASGFFEGEAPADLVRIMAGMAIAESNSAWLVRCEGVPVGGGVVQSVDGVALFAGQSTLSAFRGRGVQAALIREGLLYARSCGADLAAAMTLPGSGSQRNFERTGFRVAYTRVKVQRDLPPGPPAPSSTP
jgi:GNAT superfamily N-acetyltransferase